MIETSKIKNLSISYHDDCGLDVVLIEAKVVLWIGLPYIPG